MTSAVTPLDEQFYVFHRSAEGQRELRSALETQTAGSSASVQPQTAGSTASVRTVVLTPAQAVREDKAADSDETWSEDVLRVVAKKAKTLTGFERRTLVAALIRDLP